MKSAFGVDVAKVYDPEKRRLRRLDYYESGGAAGAAAAATAGVAMAGRGVNREAKRQKAAFHPEQDRAKALASYDAKERGLLTRIGSNKKEIKRIWANHPVHAETAKQIASQRARKQKAAEAVRLFTPPVNPENYADYKAAQLNAKKERDAANNSIKWLTRNKRSVLRAESHDPRYPLGRARAAARNYGQSLTAVRQEREAEKAKPLPKFKRDFRAMRRAKGVRGGRNAIIAAGVLGTGSYAARRTKKNEFS